MPHASIPNDAELQPTAPPGRYEGTIIQAAVEPVRPNKEDGSPRLNEDGSPLEYLNLRVMFRSPDGQMVFARTKQFAKNHTQTRQHSGSKAPRFLRQLGVDDPSHFDTDLLENMKVLIEVDQESWGLGDDKRYSNNIVDIFKA